MEIIKVIKVIHRNKVNEKPKTLQMELLIKKRVKSGNPCQFENFTEPFST